VCLMSVIWSSETVRICSLALTFAMTAKVGQPANQIG